MLFLVPGPEVPGSKFGPYILFTAVHLEGDAVDNCLTILAKSIFSQDLRYIPVAIVKLVVLSPKYFEKSLFLAFRKRIIVYK